MSVKLNAAFKYASIPNWNKNTVDKVYFDFPTKLFSAGLDVFVLWAKSLLYCYWVLIC